MIQAGSGTLLAPRRRRGITVSSAGTNSAFTTAVLADSPALYWRLGETGGTTAADASGNGRTGTYSGVTLNQTSLLSGDSNPSINANGGTVTSTYSPFAAACTIECLATRDSVGAGKVLWQTTGANEFLLVDMGSTNADTARLLPPSTDWASALAGVAQGGTFHCATIFLPAADTAEFFLNGVSLGVKTGMTTNPVGNVVVGGSGAGLGGWTGKVDEFVVFASALSAARIAAHAAAR